jgi:uncharacterized protein (DUF2147 family)
MNIASKSSLAAIATFAIFSTAQNASASELPLGIWLDNTGRGAVKITDCGGSLCGHIVWIKDSKNSSVCGTQVIGEAKPIAGGKWDGGWILDVDDDRKYQVEITPLANGRLKVMGYAGSKLLSETMIWTRAPADTKVCAS